MPKLPPPARAADLLRSLIALAVATLAAATLAAACSTTPTPGVCCVGPDDCSRLDLTEDRPCPAGQACLELQCVAATCSNLGCPPEAPVCDGDACRGCQLDAECSSGACGDDGACVAEADVVYLDPAGSDSGTCPRSAPCKTITYAGTQTAEARNHLVLENGTYIGTNLLGPGLPASTIHIHGHGATLVSPLTGDGSLLHFALPGSVRDLHLMGRGIAYYATLLGTPLNAERVTFTGVHLVANGMVTIRDFSISEPREQAIYVMGSVTLERGVIQGGSNGIVNDQATFPVVDISNVLIYRTSGRALDLARSSGRIRFVTIADAGANHGTAPHAVECGPGLAFESSIVWAPVGFAQPALSGGCTLVSTIVGPTPVPGAMNLDPLFVDAGANDYHLSSNSPARDMANTGPMLDFERDPRPRGVRLDLGADEAP